MDKLYVIKIGGNVIDDERKLASFLESFAAVKGKKILVHGGGKLATRLAEQLNIPQQLVEGRRITDEQTLKIVTMVYAGYINKNVVALLQSFSCNAIGMSGADGNVILAHKRIHPSLDYGFAGDIDQVNAYFLYSLLEQDITPVIAPVTHDGKGQLLNTNADSIAKAIAEAMSKLYEVILLYSFEKEGVMKNMDDEHSVIGEVDTATYQQLKKEGIVSDGMIPKLDNAFAAIDNGVSKVVIGNAEKLDKLIKGISGTTIK
jgi:acetylglutamate kinase